MKTIHPFMCAGKVLPGRLSIHPTEWFISHARAQVTLLNSTPIILPPKARLISPQGTNNPAKGRTIRFVSKKYVLTCPKYNMVIGKVPNCAAREIIIVPIIQLKTRP